MENSGTAAVALDSTAATVFLRRDPRTEGWALVGNKQFIVGLLCAYVYVVKVAGPRFMQGRKPYENLKPVIVIYNAAMVVLNWYFMVAYLTRSYLGGGYSFVCQGIDYDARDEMTMSFLAHCWWYEWVRVADFLDTAFFVLRKKDSHISVLHVVHHVLVVFNGWYGLAYGADGHIALTLIFNSFVHVVMYSYYFLSLLGPAVRKHLWWKRYLTQLQMFQFAVLIAHGLVPLFLECGYPLAHVYIGLPQGLFFLVMFLNFYLRNYNDRKKMTASHNASKIKVQ
ncbi:very long chain fatty acid elongase AAEL008004-like [Dermacentor andersoni]|uniref:very long chain fatty acid elongase AAEL008004-like n=1 Tax=Dermacentor andersoni TaxID=34620 RepID=UPI00215526A2|nr:elongation of very long chain fatty acids protein AAEL008004-like [Dermacentor andersoni]